MTLKLNGSTAGSVSIDAPADTSPTGTDVTLTLPTSAGSSGQVLTTNGSGTLSWGPNIPDAIDVNASAPADSVNIDSSGNVGINETSPSDFNDAGTGGVNFVLGATGSGRGVLTFASEQTGGADEPLGIINFVDSDTTNTATRGARIIGHRGSDANTAYLRFDTANSGSPTERMRIASNGNILAGSNSTWSTAGSGSSFYIHNNSDQQTLRVSNGDPGSSPYGLIGFYRNKGSLIARITTDGSSVSYNTSSDYRLKENVVDLNNATERVKQLAPKRFNWIADETATTVDGFLAHEAQTVVPEAVTGTHNEIDDEGNPVYQGIDQSKLVPLLTAALQEAIGKIETLETANASQAATIAALDARLTALEGGAS